MRTTRNGSPLTPATLSEAAAETDFSSAVEAAEFYRDLLAFGQNQRREGFDSGMQLGAKVENRVAVQAVATAMLSILGQDPGDGYTDLGKAGTWIAASDDSFAVKKEAE